MKKIMFLLVIFSVVFGLSQVNSTMAQEGMQVSPREWVLDSAGVEVIDIHYAHPLSSVERDLSVIVLRQDNITTVDASIISVGADSRGDLVVKFVPELNKDLIGETLSVELVGQFTDGALFSEAVFEGIEVKYAPMTQLQPNIEEAMEELATPTVLENDSIIILEGDKVRGDKGVGQAIQNQTEDPNCWDVNFCTPDGSFGD